MITSQKRSNSATKGYQIPAMPRVPRSAKRKRSARSKIENNQMCAFDLLAALAAEILAEKEGFWSPSRTARVSSTVYSNNQEQVGKKIPLKGAIFDQGSCADSTFAFPIIPNDQISHTTKQNFKSLEGSTTSALEKSDESENDASCKLLCSTGSGPFVHEDGKRTCTLVDPTDFDRKTPVIISSDRSIDGENSSGCTHHRYIHPNTFNEDCSEDHRRKKMPKLTYRKADPVACNDGGQPNDDMEIKPRFRSQRLFYTRQKHQRRKLFNRRSVSPVKDVNRLETALNGANKMSCESRSTNFMSEPEDHPVKLSIKSFEVPELLIEMSANATVASLKRTVMEAVMAILRDGLQVGVLLQGKKVRDDNKTLSQAGISYEDIKLNSLNFTLEPDTSRTTPPPFHSLNEPSSLPYDPHLLNMIKDKEASETTFCPPPIPILTTNCVESDHENSVDSLLLQPSLSYKPASVSKALVPTPAENPEALSITTTCKPRRPAGATQRRRIRRPFSIPEVQALVQAVEKLGTGRWRDVKLRAFGNCKHRTYVDLKDKWKTLVHTASISPRQRRGQPVPQELLDRVLSAHANWCYGPFTARV